MRTVKIGRKTYKMPKYLTRLEGAKLNGWQVRWGASRYFADSKYGGPDGSYEAAMGELKSRHAPNKTPRYVARTKPLAGKSSNLPVGISGTWQTPTKRGKKAQPQARFSVHVPLPDGGCTNRTVYIGTKETFQRNYEDALKRAVFIRELAVAEAMEVARRNLYQALSAREASYQSR